MTTAALAKIIATATASMASLIPSVLDPRDYPFVEDPTINIPAAFRFADNRIIDQAEEGSCTGHGTANAAESMLLQGGEAINLSREYIYRKGQQLGGYVGIDGAQLRDVVRGLRLYGAPPESMLPYNMRPWTPVADPVLDGEAAKRRLGTFTRIDETLPWLDRIRLIKNAMAQGKRVVVAQKVYRWIWYVSGPFNTHSTLHTEVPGYMDWIGNHCMWLNGWDDNLSLGSWIYEQSWGPGYGDNGFLAMSYTSVMDMFEIWVLEDFAGQPAKYSPAQKQVASLYAALFGRAPEVAGMDYWASEITKRSWADVAQSMYDVAAARRYYPNGLSHEQIATSFYHNVLGRTPDAEGLAYWVAELDAGKTYGAVIVNMIAAVQQYTGTDPYALASQALLNNKVQLGLFYRTMGVIDVPSCEHAFDAMTAETASLTAAMIALRDATAA